MKRVYALLFNLTIISTHGVAKTSKIDSKYEANKQEKSINKKVKSKNIKLSDYKIKNGDTIFAIARQHHTTVAEVELTNKLTKDERLEIGRSLKVPRDTYFPNKNISKTTITKTNVITKQKELKHTIKEGDTLLAIALDNNTSLSKLEEINSFSSDKKLKLGEVILITKKEDITHKIQEGDTLLAIALDNNTSLSKLEEINSFSSDKKLKLGEVILIPHAKETTPESSKIAKIDNSKTKIASIKRDKKIKKAQIVHTIKKGDTLYELAIKYDTTVANLKKMNDLDPKKSLKLGDKLALAKRPKASKIKSPKKIKTKSKIKKSDTKLASKKIKKKKINLSKNIKTKRVAKRKFVVKSKPNRESFIEMLGLGSSSLKLSSAKKQLGKRYVWGATGPYTFDCSGFTKYVCNKNGVYIPRTSINQSKIGKRVSRKNLKAGDLIFFDTSRRHRGYINHVGIYIGNNKFIHASSAKRKVVITSLNAPFYKSRFKWGSRVKG